jgi:regulator of protease activity HflC (stomatin/prohibitin superfamily)
LRAFATREVVLYLASRTLDAILDERQTTARDALRGAIQLRLDAAHSGIELTAVVIEAIHPPAGAAAAWHAVQAAQIEAQTLVARAHGAAAEQIGAASEQAASLIAGADAAAADSRAQANVQGIGFAADSAASRADEAAGVAFLFEYRMHRLASGLANKHLTVLDARLAAQRGAVVDLREARPSSDTGNRAGY